MEKTKLRKEMELKKSFKNLWKKYKSNPKNKENVESFYKKFSKNLREDFGEKRARGVLKENYRE